ncbi:MAG: ATP-binding protein [Vicinamibacterales bacterium]
MVAVNDVHLTGTDRLVLARWLPWVLPVTLAIWAALYEVVEHELGLIVGGANFGLEMVVFGVAGPAAVFLALVYMRRIIHARVDAEQATALLNRGLEREVAERTTHLEDAQRTLRSQTERLEVMNVELLELDELKSDFVALVSHELRAPLTNLSGGIELIAADAASLPPSSQRTLEIIRTESARLQALVASILDVSRLEAGHLQLTLGPVSIEALLRTCAASITAHEPRRISIHSSGSIPPVWADEIYLEEVLRNVLVNALKYSPPGDPVTVALARLGDEVAVDITNRGPAISSEDQSRLFDPFFRGGGERHRQPGYGLGLYFSRRLLDAQQSQIRVTSPAFPGAADPGATFTVTLPKAGAEGA